MKVRLAKISGPIAPDKKSKYQRIRFAENLHDEALSLYKLEKCQLCGEKITTLHNSHCLPQFILKEISKGGLIRLGQDLSGVGRTNAKHSLSDSLTFKNICSQCDNNFFKDYENQNLFYEPINDLILNEIAAKNCLRYIFKNNVRKLYNKNILEKFPHANTQLFENQKFLAEIDEFEYKETLRKIVKNKNDSLFYLIDDINLPYKTAMAFQGPIALQCDFDGSAINDTHNYNPNYKIQTLNVCVFPHDKGTKIILFCKHNSNRLRKFYKKFKKLDLDKKLYCINYMILLESEEWFVKWNFDEKLINQETRDLISTVDEIEIGTTYEENFSANREEYIKEASEIVREKFKLKTEGNIFNFLAKN